MLTRSNYGIDGLSVAPPDRCFHPLRVVNPYTYDLLYVPCRHCASCMYNKIVDWSSRVSDEVKQHRYSFFFTLTYDNEHIPLYERVCPHVIRNDTRKGDEYLPSFMFGDYPLSSFTPPHGVYGDYFGVLCKSDVQKFMKRLRRYIDYNFKNLSKDEKKVRYFICGEYGSKYRRPHYHGILFTDCEWLSRKLPEVIRTCWSLCSQSLIDVQLVSGSAPQYVAKYCNGYACYDEILSLEPFKPFHLASKNPTLGAFRSDRKKILDILVNRLVECLVPTGKQETPFAYIPISDTLLSRYFSPCQGFGLSDDSYKLSVYEKYAFGRYKKVYDKELKRYDECHLRGYEYLSVKDSFKYSDYRFYRSVRSFCGFHSHVPFRDALGNIHKFIDVFFTPSIVIHLFSLLYSAYKLYYMNRFFANLEIASQDDGFDKYKLLLFYPTVLYEIPHYCSHYDWYHRPWMDGLTLDDVLSTFGFDYYDVYTDGVDDSFLMAIDFVKDTYAGYKTDLYDTLLRSDKKKKFNELYNNFNV